MFRGRTTPIVRALGALVALLILATTFVEVDISSRSATAATEASALNHQTYASNATATSTEQQALAHLAAARDALTTTETVRKSAVAYLAKSRGKTIGGKARQALAALVSDAGPATVTLAAIRVIESSLERVNFAHNEVWGHDADPSASRELINTLSRSTDALSAHSAHIQSARAAVAHAVEKWKAREKRRAAAARAAADLAKAGAASARSGSAQVSSGSRTFRVHVRIMTKSANSADDRKVQKQVDAGGQVAIRYLGAGVTIVAAHNTSDSTALALRKGDTVVFSGAMSGTYSVTGSLDVVSGAKIESVLPLHASVMMQTCYFGSNRMRIVGLARI
jgi:hypothetical protein